MQSSALVGGNRNNGALCGAGTVNLNNPLSNSNTNIGASLSFLWHNIFTFSAPHRLVKIKPLSEGLGRATEEPLGHKKVQKYENA